MSASDNLSQSSAKDEKPMSNTQTAFSILRDMILKNELASGSNHLEGELADLLGMSRTPVREAALILEMQGLVEVKPRHGIRVLPLSSKDMSEIYEILTALEALSAELAADKNLPEEEFIVAEQSILDMENAIEVKDLEAWAKADEVFHRELVRLGGNQRIANVVKKYSNQVSRAKNLTLNLRPAPSKSNEDHRIVLDAIKAGDSQTARQIHTDHRVQAKAILLGILDKYGFQNL